jgi:hypothetical protein
MEEGINRNIGAGMVAEIAAAQHCNHHFFWCFVKIRSNCSKGIILYP